jgi:hypothetical protein
MNRGKPRNGIRSVRRQGRDEPGRRKQLGRKVKLKTKTNTSVNNSTDQGPDFSF